MTKDGPAGRALTDFEKKFAKAFGDGAMKSEHPLTPYEVISTGSLSLDYALGVGGLLEGRLHEIWGPESIGKTSLCLVAMAMAQRKHKHKRVAWIDMEHVWDPAWAQALGVDLSRVGLFVPDTAEDVADSMKMIVDSGLYSMVTLDSIGGMFAKVEAEKDSGDAVMGKQAQIVTRMVKINAVAAAKNGTVVAMINQVRANLSYGADTTTGGGFALKHATTIKLKMKRTATPPLTVKILGEEIPVAQEIAILVERNKVAPRGRVATVMLKNVATDKYGPVGFDQVDEATNLGIKLGIIGQTGGWYTLPDGQRLNGRERVVEHLRANPQQVDDIRTKVISIRAQEVHVESEQTDEESEAAALKDLQDNVKMPNFRHAENEG